MTQYEKLVQKFKENPTALSLFEIEKILEKCGCTKINAKGSHVKYKIIELAVPIHNGDCKNFYKKEILKRLLKEKLL